MDVVLMTEQETRLILNVLKANYPQSFRIGKEEAVAMLELWKMQFKEIPYEFVRDAVNRIISNDNREFAPNVGQVKKRILDNLAPDTDTMAIHAWEEFRRFISNTSTWAPMEEELPLYNKLDAITRRLYTYREAKGLAQLDKNTLEYRRSEFVKLYKDLTNKKNEKLMQEGNLVELAGGTDRFLSLGYTSEHVDKFKALAMKESRIEE